MTVSLRVGQQDVDIKLSGHFIKEIHCVFVSETNEQGEGETATPPSHLHNSFITPPSRLHHASITPQ